MNPIYLLYLTKFFLFFVSMMPCMARITLSLFIACTERRQLYCSWDRGQHLVHFPLTYRCINVVACVLVWRWRLLEWLKFLLHNVHWNGFSPVWILVWCWRLLRWLNVLLHNVHWNCVTRYLVILITYPAISKWTFTENRWLFNSTVISESIWLTDTFSNRTSSQLSDLQSKFHIGEKPLPCTLCKKTCIGASSLECHIMTHTGEKPFRCTLCNKQLKKPGRFQCHIRTHTGQKPFQCQLCHKTFNHSNNFQYQDSYRRETISVHTV